MFPGQHRRLLRIEHEALVVTVKGPNLDIRRQYRATNVWAKRDGRW
jgi:hypothetical protein